MSYFVRFIGFPYLNLILSRLDNYPIRGDRICTTIITRLGAIYYVYYCIDKKIHFSSISRILLFIKSRWFIPFVGEVGHLLISGLWRMALELFPMPHAPYPKTPIRQGGVSSSHS